MKTKKNLQKSINGIRFNHFPILALTLIMLSCQEEIKIEKISFTTIPEPIELKDYYLVEGDILIPKSERHDHEHGRVSQASTHNLVVYSNQPSIRVFFGVPLWNDEIQQALNDWTNITSSSISFSSTTNASLADIIIQVDNGTLPSNTIAAATFPSNGRAGSVIQVNTDFNNGVISSGQKRYNIVHELGHCIGLRHTNWASRGESANPHGANTVPGTPTSDFNSVMNGGTANNTWNGFSINDILAVRILYPQNAQVTNGIISPNGGEVYVGPNWGGGSTVTRIDINLRTSNFNPTRVAVDLLDGNNRNWYYGTFDVVNGSFFVTDRFAFGSYRLKITDVNNPNNWDESDGTITITLR